MADLKAWSHGVRKANYVECAKNRFPGIPAGLTRLSSIHIKPRKEYPSRQTSRRRISHVILVQIYFSFQRVHLSVTILN